MKRYLALLIAALVVSCGGEGGGDGGAAGGGSTSGGGGTSGSGANGNIPAVAGPRIEESDAAVTLGAGWTSTNPRMGWSGGTAVQTSVVGATASVSFTGNSIRWLGGRGREKGKALVRVDGGPPREADSFINTGDVVRTPILTIYDLNDGPHTLTIEVVSGVVVIDAFDVQPRTTVSHWQDTDPNAKYSAGWTKATTNAPWSGNGAANPPELPVTAQETYTPGETLTLPFRGTGISWVGYRGPDGGIATVQIDGGSPVEVDTYAPAAKFQEVVFTASGLADTNHTLTITATGLRNPASSAPRIVVDAFDVMTLGKRYEENHAAVAYVGNAWNRHHTARVWSGGASATSNLTGAKINFTFTGSSVSVIGCQKSSAGGTANFYIDGVLVKEVRMRQSYPIEGYQMPVFRADGLSNGQHTLTVEVTSTNEGPYVVVDAFDVHP
jgi:hypothetical protein